MTWEIFWRLVLAVAIGAAVGAERESRDKAAGFRTMTLISLGSALFTIYSVRIGAGDSNSARIAAQIVSGVGFLGAGAIIREGPRISGLTTAATIWLVASLGMGVGAGDWRISLTAAAITLGVLIAFPPLEHWIDSRREAETYVVRCKRQAVDRLDGMVTDSGLHRLTHKLSREGEAAIVSWTLIGGHERHSRLRRQLFDDGDVEGLET